MIPKYASKEKGQILKGSTVYLSGPMDFVASRQTEKNYGWRNRVGQFLAKRGVRVYDPWNKPLARGLGDYGREDEFSTSKRTKWTFEDSPQADKTRAELCREFWSTLHIDLRMTDSADFLVAFVPTNIYSVGTVHEIVTARNQHKPVLFVSPVVNFSAYDQLNERLQKKSDTESLELLQRLSEEAPLRTNQFGIPSMWYMGLIDGHYFFDGFGFQEFRKEFGWPEGPLDDHENRHRPLRPLLPYLDNLDRKRIPLRYDIEQNIYLPNTDWLIFEKGTSSGSGTRKADSRKKARTEAKRKKSRRK